MPERPASSKLKRTFYLDPGVVVALSELQTEEFRRTGRKPELSELVTRGIQKLQKVGKR